MYISQEISLSQNKYFWQLLSQPQLHSHGGEQYCFLPVSHLFVSAEGFGDSSDVFPLKSFQPMNCSLLTVLCLWYIWQKKMTTDASFTNCHSHYFLHQSNEHHDVLLHYYLKSRISMLGEKAADKHFSEYKSYKMSTTGNFLQERIRTHLRMSEKRRNWNKFQLHLKDWNKQTLENMYQRVL